MGLVIKPERLARRRAAFKWQCIASATFAVIIIFYPEGMSRDFKNHRKSVKLERALIRLIINYRNCRATKSN